MLVRCMDRRTASRAVGAVMCQSLRLTTSRQSVMVMPSNPSVSRSSRLRY